MVKRLGEWFPFSSELYCRKLILYDRMFWDAHEEPLVEKMSPFSLATCAFVCAAPFGGSVAVIHAVPPPTNADDNEELVACRVHVYTSAGEFQASLSLPGEAGLPIDMGWTKEEVLVILTDQQACVFFGAIHLGSSSLNSDGSSSSCIIRLRDHATSPSSHPAGIYLTPTFLTCMHPEGLFCIDENRWMRGLMHVERQGPKVQDPVQFEAGLLPTTLDFIPAEWNDEGDTVFYLTSRSRLQKGDSTLHVFTSSHGLKEKVQKQIPGRVLAMKVNHSGLQVALFTDRAELHILSSNLKSVEFSIKLGSRSRRPKKMEWCGSSFIVLHFNDAVFHEYYSSPTVAPMFSLIIPTLPEASVKYERFDWEREGSGHVVTVSEIDGIRVITEKSCYFLEQVPKSLVSLCRIKPLSLSAQLVAAYADGKNCLPTVCRLLSTWGGGSFAGSIDEIIDAAEHEFSPDQQHLLLAAASFSNEVHRLYDSDTFVDIVRRLRVLHTVRNYPGCRIPLSFRQYCMLSGLEQMRSLAPSEAQVLVDRLANRCCFQLAFDIAGALNTKPLRLLSQWSCHKVRDSSLDDDTVYAHIRDVLQRYPGSSYVESSVVAFRSGRSALAIALLKEDVSVHRKVMMFLLLGQWELALHWADLGDDADLIHLALVYAISSVEDYSKLFSVLLGHPTVLAWMLLGARLLTAWRTLINGICRKQFDFNIALYCARSCIARALEGGKGKAKQESSGRSQALLNENASQTIADQFYMPPDGRSDNRTFTAVDTQLESILRALAPPSLDDALAALGECRKVERTVSGSFGEVGSATATKISSTVFSPIFAETSDGEWRWLSMHFELIELQKRLAAEHTDPRFLRSSVGHTLYLCLTHGDEGKAKELRAKYRVSEKKYTYTKLCALCDTGRWAEAEKLGGVLGGRVTSRPSIGYQSFVEQFVLHSRVESALLLIPKLDDVTRRVDWLMHLQQPRLAIDDAFREKDADLIQHVLKRTTDLPVREYGLRCLQELK
ncbi:hypothetical protein ECC02_002788 [Trypanosoma cruzi]|uniref:Vacuolar protein sorting protein 16 n=1 Tax=Trypanosoma cruzi TaxID=5693 RepID=A0A7J6YC93_TRYCR|nr:hypothetical protein ECC02_002788 [Trypanosoma cruzi]